MTTIPKFRRRFVPFNMIYKNIDAVTNIFDKIRRFNRNIEKLYLNHSTALSKDAIDFSLAYARMKFILL